MSIRQGFFWILLFTLGLSLQALAQRPKVSCEVACEPYPVNLDSIIALMDMVSLGVTDETLQLTGTSLVKGNGVALKNRIVTCTHTQFCAALRRRLPALRFYNCPNLKEGQEIWVSWEWSLVP